MRKAVVCAGCTDTLRSENTTFKPCQLSSKINSQQCRRPAAHHLLKLRVACASGCRADAGVHYPAPPRVCKAAAAAAAWRLVSCHKVWPLQEHLPVCHALRHVHRRHGGLCGAGGAVAGAHAIRAKQSDGGAVLQALQQLGLVALQVGLPVREALLIGHLHTCTWVCTATAGQYIVADSPVAETLVEIQWHWQLLNILLVPCMRYKGLLCPSPAYA